jgi:HEAT repeat protein
LAATDAARAFQAVVSLARQPETSVPWLREHVKPVAQPDPKHLAELVADLNEDNFRRRTKATTELEQLGETAAPALKKALDDHPTVEVRRRVELLLAKLSAHNLPPSQLRQVRAVEALEQIATPQARQLLQELAQGAPAARLTREARASLGRLAKRGTP